MPCFFHPEPLAGLFRLCSHMQMERIDPETLAVHLEVALVCSPPDTLEALADSDRIRRQRATHCLAAHLADRLACFEVRASGDLGGQAVLFQDGGVG